MGGVEAFLFFLALKGEARREEVRARFPELVPFLRALGEELEIQGETFRLLRPLRLSWFAPLFQRHARREDPLWPLALERLIEAAHASAEAGEAWVEGEGLLRVARAFQRGSEALLRGEAGAALRAYGEGFGLLEKAGLPFPSAALALLALAQEAFRPGGKGRRTAAKALERNPTPWARALAEGVLKGNLDPPLPPQGS